MASKLAGMELPRGARPLMRSAAGASYKAAQRRTAQEDARILRKLRQDARASQRGAERLRHRPTTQGSITPQRRDKAPVKASVFA